MLFFPWDIGKEKFVDRCDAQCAACAAEYVTASAQSCFPVKAATAAAVVLTLSGLTAEVALQVCLQRMLSCLGRTFAIGSLQV